MPEFQVHPSSPRLVRDSKDAGDLGHCWSHVTRRPREGVCGIKDGATQEQSWTRSTHPSLNCPFHQLARRDRTQGLTRQARQMLHP